MYNKNEIIKMNDNGYTFYEASPFFNSTYNAICSVINRAQKEVNKSIYNYEEIKRLADEGLTAAEISNKIGISKKWLYQSAKDNNINIIKECKKKYIEVVKLNNQGKTIKEISCLTNIKYNNIYAYFYRNNIPFKEDNGILTGYSLLPMNEYKAYMLGIIFGDGSLGKSTKQEIEIAMNDFDVLNCINRNVFDNKININTRILKSGKTNYRLGIYNSKIWEEAIYNFELCNNKSAVIKFPNLDEKYLSHFVRGLVDSDGSFFLDNNKLTFAYGSCSLFFITKLKDVLMKYCNVNNIKILRINRKSNDYYTIKWCNKKDPYAIGRWVYKDSENNRGERKFLIWNNFNK